MTTTDITNLMHTYYDWLRDKTAVTAIDGEWSVITTPYLDRHNDYLQLYVRPTLTGGLELSDDGYTIADLASTGCDLQTPRRTQLLQTTLNGLGSIESEIHLQFIAPMTNLPTKNIIWSKQCWPSTIFFIPPQPTNQVYLSTM